MGGAYHKAPDANIPLPDRRRPGSTQPSGMEPEHRAVRGALPAVEGHAVEIAVTIPDKAVFEIAAHLAAEIAEHRLRTARRDVEDHAATGRPAARAAMARQADQ